MFNIIILGITSLLTDISSEMVYPILPAYLVSQLGASPAILGLIEGIAESLASLLKVFSGYFSDLIKKRKPFTLIGYGSSMVGKLLLYASAGWGMVLAGRIVDRFGKGVRTAPRDALIAQSSQPGKRGAAFGLHRAMDTLGAVTGVIIAYWVIVRYNGQMKNVFLFSLIPAFLGVVFLFWVKEKKAPAIAAVKKLEFKWGALDKRLRAFLIVTFIFTLGNSSNQFLLLRAQNQGASLAQVVLMYLLYNVVYLAVAYPAARLSDVIGRKRLLVLGYFCYGLVYLGFGLARGFGSYWLLFAFYGIYIGATEGVEKALVSDIAPVESRATVIGLHAALVGIGLLPASILAGISWKVFGASAPFYFGAVMGVAASIGLGVVLKEL